MCGPSLAHNAPNFPLVPLAPTPCLVPAVAPAVRPKPYARPVVRSQYRSVFNTPASSATSRSTSKNNRLSTLRIVVTPSVAVPPAKRLTFQTPCVEGKRVEFPAAPAVELPKIPLARAQPPVDGFVLTTKQETKAPPQDCALSLKYQPSFRPHSLPSQDLEFHAMRIGLPFPARAASTLLHVNHAQSARSASPSAVAAGDRTTPPIAAPADLSPTEPVEPVVRVRSTVGKRIRLRRPPPLKSTATTDSTTIVKPLGVSTIGDCSTEALNFRSTLLLPVIGRPPVRQNLLLPVVDSTDRARRLVLCRWKPFTSGSARKVELYLVRVEGSNEWAAPLLLPDSTMVTNELRAPSAHEAPELPRQVEERTRQGRVSKRVGFTRPWAEEGVYQVIVLHNRVFSVTTKDPRDTTDYVAATPDPDSTAIMSWANGSNAAALRMWGTVGVWLTLDRLPLIPQVVGLEVPSARTFFRPAAHSSLTEIGNRFASSYFSAGIRFVITAVRTKQPEHTERAGDKVLLVWPKGEDPSTPSLGGLRRPRESIAEAIDRILTHIIGPTVSQLSTFSEHNPGGINGTVMRVWAQFQALAVLRQYGGKDRPCTPFR